MRARVRISVFSGAMGGLACLCCGAAEVTEAALDAWGAEIAELRGYEKELRQAGDGVRRRQLAERAPQDTARQILANLSEGDVDAAGELEAARFRTGYRMRILYFLEKWDEVQLAARELVSGRTWVGGAVRVLAARAGRVADGDSQRRFLAISADLYPLSRARRRTDSRMNQIPPGFYADRAVSSIPRPDILRLREVAEQWEEARRFREAADAYIEAVMAISGSRLDRPTLSSGWLGMEHACGLWLRAGEMLWQAGAREDAMEALAKGMVFGTDADFRTGLGLLELFKEEVREAGEEAEDSDRLVARHLLRIADLYADMNAHPRAFWLLEQHRELLGEEFDTRFEILMRDWLRVVEHRLSVYVPVRGQIYAFGVDIVPEENRPKVRVPAGMDPRALRAAQEAVTALDAPDAAP